MTITIVAGKSSSATSVALAKGDVAVLTATVDAGELPAGAWAKDGVALAGQTAATLLVTMSSSGSQAGSYIYEPADGTVPPSTPITVTKRSVIAALVHSPVIIWFLVILVVYVAGSVALLSGRITVKAYADADWVTARCYLFASLTLVAFLALVQATGYAASGGGSGLVALFAGSDRRASTSKFQYLMWTLLLGFVLAYVGARAAISGGDFTCAADHASNCIPSDNWTSYLLLLGLPSGVAVAAKGIVSYKVQSGTLQKTDNAAGFALSDLATDDAGSPDLVDIQYLLFNLIAAAYVVAKFGANGTLPVIPDLLLGLTSAAAGTYVLNKSLQTNAPVITAVVPSLIVAGQAVEISGQNLFPAGSNSNSIDVLAGGIRTRGTRNPSTQLRDTITFTAPVGMSAADPTVHVITSALIQSDGFPVTFATATIYGWQGAVPSAAAGQVGLRIGGLPAGVDAADIVVRIAGLTTDGVNLAGSVVTADKPATISSTVDVTVYYAGQSVSATLPVA